MLSWKRRVGWLAVVFAAVLSLSGSGQDFKLIGPDRPIAPGETISILTEGLSVDDAARSEWSYAPKQIAGTTLRDTFGWSRKPVLEFRSLNSGMYTVTVSLPATNPENRFVTPLVEAVAAAEQLAPKEPLITVMREAADKLVAKYPFVSGKSASCVIEVKGAPIVSPPPDAEPSAAARAAAEPIRLALTVNKPKAANLALVYTGMVNVAILDGGSQLSTTKRVQDWIAETLRNAPGVSDPPLVHDKMDAAVASVAGIAADTNGVWVDRPLTSVVYLKIVDGLRGVAWACNRAATVEQVSRVTYVYEKDNNLIPGPVSKAFDALNRQGIIATEFEEDTITANGTVPLQYVVALKAAKDAGEPCLVVQAGDSVVRVVKNPQTEAQVMEAVK